MSHLNTKQPELLPCPFCGAGTTSIREDGRIWTGQRYSEPSSVSVRHYCEPVDGQPSRAIHRVGRDMESAIAAWNRRTSAAQVEEAQLSELRKDAARLVAAAPDLLEAAQRFEEVMDESFGYPDTASEFDKLNKAAAAARAAIVKATGGAA